MQENEMISALYVNVVCLTRNTTITETQSRNMTQRTKKEESPGEISLRSLS